MGSTLKVKGFNIEGTTYRIPGVTANEDGLLSAKDYQKFLDYEDRLAAITKSISELDSSVFPLTINVSGGAVFEKGTTQNITVSWVLKKGNVVTAPDSVKVNGSPVTGSLKVFSGVTTNTVYTVEASKNSVIRTGSTSVRFVNPSYMGVVANDFAANEANIKMLTKNISESRGRVLSNATLNNQKVCYAYPKSFGELTTIKDANNFEYINSYQRAELTIDGELYYVYVLKDATSISVFKQIYS